MKKNELNKVISIITPSFNQGEYLEDAIKSICTQKGDFFIDYIIVDNESNDNSLDTIIKYSNIIKQGVLVKTISGVDFFKDKKHLIKCKGVSIRYLCEKDNGHADGLNKGFAIAIGNSLAWLNSDDKYHPGAFQKVIEIFKKFPEVEWITGRTTWYDKQGNCTGEVNSYKNIYDFLVGNYQWIQQESTFWKRSLWNKVGATINKKYKFMVDGELWCRFFQKAELYHVDERLGGYRTHETNRAREFHNKVLEEMEKAVSQLRLQTNRKMIENSKFMISIPEDLSSLEEIKKLKYKVIKLDKQNNWLISNLYSAIYNQSQLIKNLTLENTYYKSLTSNSSSTDGSSVKNTNNFFWKNIKLFYLRLKRIFKKL